MPFDSRTLRASASAFAIAAGASFIMPFIMPGGSAAAQEDRSFIQLDTITIFATRSPRDVNDVPQNVTVIGGDEIDAEAMTDFDKLTRKVPGVIVSRQTSGTDPFSTLGGFTIRGVGGNRVQIAVDGSRTAERIIDGPREFVNLDFIKSVEIVRGPASVLWGSDALGGLVAFETIDPEDILKPGAKVGGELKTSFDSENDAFKKTGIAAISVDPTAQFLFAYSNLTADEPKRSQARADGGINGCPRNVALGATPCDEFEPTDTDIDSYLAKLVLKPTPRHRFELTADITDRVTKVDQRYDLGPALSSSVFTLDYKRELDIYRRRFAIEHVFDINGVFFESAKWVASYSPQGYERSGRRVRNETSGDRTIRNDSLKYSEDFFEGEFQLVSKFNLGGTTHLLTYGFDGDFTKTNYERVDITTNVTKGVVTKARAGGFNFANAETTRADLFLQNEIGLFGGVVEVIPAVRFATYNIEPKPDADYRPVAGAEPREISEEALTFKVGATVNLNENFSVYGQFAQGFKMPTAQQLYTSLPGKFFDLIPAPDLKPEKVDSYELGLRGKFALGQFSANVFYADYTDFIQPFFNPPGTNDYTYRNLSSVELYGVEGSFEFELVPNLVGYGSVSYQFGDQKASPTAEKEAYNNANPLNGVAGLRYLFEEQNLELDFVSIWSAAVKRQNDPDNFKPDSYVVFDFHSIWKPTEYFELSAGVLNIFNERYFKWPLPGDYEVNSSARVARTNPLELQTQPGRTFRVSATARF